METKTTCVNGMVFSYKDQITEAISLTEWFEHYFDVVIIKSNNHIYKEGNKYKAIGVTSIIHYDYNSATNKLHNTDETNY